MGYRESCFEEQLATKESEYYHYLIGGGRFLNVSNIYFIQVIFYL